MNRKEARLYRVTRGVYASTVGVAAQILLPFWQAAAAATAVVLAVNFVALTYCAVTDYFAEGAA